MPLARRRILAAPLFAAPLLAAPLFSARPAAALAPRPTVASFSILADMVGEVGGPLLAVESLIGPDADAHGFQPSPSHAETVSRARFVVLNGLGFEGWMPRLIRASGFRGTEIIASRGIATLRNRAHGHGHGHGHGHAHGHGHGHGHGHAHAHGEEDPHIWQDPRRVQAMVRTIAEGLAAADPDGAATYRANAARYAAELQALDSWVEAEIAPIPRARRRVVTSHHAFAYFGDRYGIDFLSPQGVTTRGEPSAQQIARLIQEIRRERITALFVEGGMSPRVLERVAAESGARIGGKLFSDALSAPGGAAPSYVALIRHNTRMIVEALAG